MLSQRREPFRQCSGDVCGNLGRRSAGFGMIAINIEGKAKKPYLGRGLLLNKNQYF
jgi:hypothetical protein